MVGSLIGWFLIGIRSFSDDDSLGNALQLLAAFHGRSGGEVRRLLVLAYNLGAFSMELRSFLLDSPQHWFVLDWVFARFLTTTFFRKCAPAPSRLSMADDGGEVRRLRVIASNLGAFSMESGSCLLDSPAALLGS